MKTYGRDNKPAVVPEAGSFKTAHKRAQAGFTLVEIAVVLVIIGLLLGGVLKGQELITNAKVRSVTASFDSITTAYYAYQERTGRIPGMTSSGVSDEAFWQDLRREGFIGGDAEDDVGPTHDLSGVWEARQGGAATAAMFTTPHICATQIADTYAQGMDIKLDDGLSDKGSVRSGTENETAATSADASSAESSGYTANKTLYTVCKRL